MIGKKVDGEGQIWDDAGNVVGRCELVYGENTEPEGPFAGFEGLQIQKDGTVTMPSGDIIGRIIEGDIKRLMGHTVDEDGDVVDKNGNTIGKAERWEPEGSWGLGLGALGKTCSVEHWQGLSRQTLH